MQLRPSRRTQARPPSKGACQSHWTAHHTRMLKTNHGAQPKNRAPYRRPHAQWRPRPLDLPPLPTCDRSLVHLLARRRFTIRHSAKRHLLRRRCCQFRPSRQQQKRCREVPQLDEGLSLIGMAWLKQPVGSRRRLRTHLLRSRQKRAQSSRQRQSRHCTLNRASMR